MEISSAIAGVGTDNLRRDLFHLCSDPLPFRKVNFTVEGHEKCTLSEADDYIQAQLEAVGATVKRSACQVQALRCDSTKPLHHWYSRPDPEDPWHTAHNIEASVVGNEFPDEIIQLISHKDSMSWIDSPGAHDNGAGTVANLELFRALAALPLRRTVRVLFCNEEHSPWTSRIAADEAFERGDNIIAVLNQDSLDGKCDEDMASGRLLHTVCYSTNEGRPLAELTARLNQRLRIGLDVQIVFKEHVNDDDGMFIKAGFPRTVMNLGSFPYVDSQYHLVGDRPERVNLENLRRSTQLVLAVVLELDQNGASTPKT